MFSGEKGLGMPRGELQTAPSEAVDPNAELQTPHQGYDPPCVAVNSLVLQKRLLLPLDGKLSPVSSCRRPPLAETPNLGGTTCVPTTVLCSGTTSPAEPSMGLHLLPPWSKGIGHSENLAISAFLHQFKERSGPAPTCTKDVNPRPLSLKVEGSLAASLSSADISSLSWTTPATAELV